MWAEEFDYSGPPKDSIWSYDLGGGGWGNNELQTYTDLPENVVVQDDVLHITAIQNGSTFTSARIKTEEKFSFAYGTLEARIKPPDLNAGLWPAFWTLGAEHYEVGWPQAGEIDIFEMGQGLAVVEGMVNNRVVSAAHWDILGEYATYAYWYDAPVDLTQDFHIYKMEWTPSSIATFVDNIKIWEMDISEPNCFSCQELHSPHHILLNMAVGGGFTSGGTSSSSAGAASSSSYGSSCAGSSSSAGASSSSGGDCGFRGPEDITAPLPAVMEVDWVRLYDNGHTIIKTSLSEENWVPIIDSAVTSIEVPSPATPGPTISKLFQRDATEPPVVDLASNNSEEWTDSSGGQSSPSTTTARSSSMADEEATSSAVSGLNVFDSNGQSTPASSSSQLPYTMTLLSGFLSIVVFSGAISYS
jgi:beta-glucanase (GH16 family)